MTNTNNLNAKLLKLNKAIEPIKKELENPYYQSKYADINKIIAEIRPKLVELGLVILQPLTSLPDGRPAIETIIVDTDSGETFGEGKLYPLIEVADVQKAGAVITYTRRYALLSVLVLETEDDDGESATTRPATRTNYSFSKPTTSQTITAKCPRCGAPMAISKKTGKQYCSAKCWIYNNYYHQPKKQQPEDTIEEEPIEEEPIDINEIPF